MTLILHFFHLSGHFIPYTVIFSVMDHIPNVIINSRQLFRNKLLCNFLLSASITALIDGDLVLLLNVIVTQGNRLFTQIYQLSGT